MHVIKWQFEHIYWYIEDVANTMELIPWTHILFTISVQQTNFPG